MNYGLPTSLELGTHNSAQFEESVPPQQTFETLTEILQSNVLDKRIKIVTINVMHKLIQLDMLLALAIHKRSKTHTLMKLQNTVPFTQKFLISLAITIAL